MIKKTYSTKTAVQKYFKAKDLDQLRYLLGIEVSCTRKDFVLSQHKYVVSLL